MSTTHEHRTMNTAPKKILIVEDEADLAALIFDYATAHGYAAHIIHNGAEALRYLQTQAVDFLILDLMLPDLDGLSLCRELRTFSSIPVIMVTAKVEEIDRILGLEIGADDYLCKPFSPRELMARVKTILKRIEPVAADLPSSPAKPPTLEIDHQARRITLHSQVLDLTRSEYVILVHFATHVGQVFSRAQLLDIANQDCLDTTDRAIDSHIKNLRKKLSHILPGTTPIHSIYGLGYRFDAW